MGNCLNEKNETIGDSASMGHEQYKIIGNEFFRSKRYEEAIHHYTRAIKLNSDISVYYSNRAICFYKLKNYISSFQDGHKAYKLDKFNCKAIYMCIKSKASQALILSPNSFSYFKESLAFFYYLKILPSEKYTDPMQKLFKHLENKILSLKPYIEKYHKRSKIENYYKLLIPKALYSKLYNLLRAKDFRIESFICPLTLEFFEDPVNISSGNTYERKMVENLICNNDISDPLTRKSFSRYYVYGNKAVRNGVAWYARMYPEIVYMSDNKDFEI